MARPLRLEYPGALYHITSRGNERKKIFLCDEDRKLFLSLLSKVVAKYRWTCHAYCLMDNHYHLLIGGKGGGGKGVMPCIMHCLGGVSMKTTAIVLYIFLAVGCSTIRGSIQSEYKQTSKGAFPIQYKFLDFPAERKVELSYYNDHNKTVCFSPSHWPNQAGKIDGAGGRVVLVVGEKRFPLEDFNTGYCPGCATSVEPGETISGFLLYEDFSLPEELVNEGKKLKFVTYGFFCKKRKK